MAFWRKKKNQFVHIQQMLEQEPHLSAREIARRLGVAVSTITRMLPSMEEAGYLLSEDDEGKLSVFKGKM